MERDEHFDPTTIVERYVRQALVGGDRDVVAALVDSDEIPGLTEQFNAAFTDRAVNSFGPIFASRAGGHVACYANLHLRQVAPFLHINAVGGTADVDVVAIFQVDDAKITHVWVEWDMASLMVATTRS